MHTGGLPEKKRLATKATKKEIMFNVQFPMFNECSMLKCSISQKAWANFLDIRILVID
jgi:hypothetical protein